MNIPAPSDTVPIASPQTSPAKMSINISYHHNNKFKTTNSKLQLEAFSRQLSVISYSLLFSFFNLHCVNEICFLIFRLQVFQYSFASRFAWHQCE